MSRCTFDFHGECDPCVLNAGHDGLHECKHERERRAEIGQPMADVENRRHDDA
jgi:hypothetical protein